MVVSVCACGSGVRSVDKTGSASPYVKVKLISGDGHKTKQKTEMVADNLDPVYDAQLATWLFT